MRCEHPLLQAANNSHTTVTTTIRLRFDCRSTALRLFNVLRHDRAAALRRE